MGGPMAPADVSDAELLERFVTGQDGSAFAALMARHGPMVFGVCRRLLRHSQDAEDAFQATFLILVRKAASIGQSELVGNWLYGVAMRVATRARLLTARRREREIADLERLAAAAGETNEASALSEAIVEEVERLPAKYRGPVVLCYLEGRTHEEAAGQLHWPIGTVKGRLSRARDMLRKRLTRRGLVLSTAALSTTLAAEASAASLPPALIDLTLKAAIHGPISAQTAALTKGVLHTMFVSKMKTVATLVLTLAAVVGGTGAFAYHFLATEGDKKTDKENILGEWKVDSAKVKGAEPQGEEGENIKNVTVEFTAEKVIVKIKGGDKESSYTLDPTAKPKAIDIVHTRPDGSEEKVKGIYKLDGDTLTICASHRGGEERPTEFESKEGSNLLLLFLKRVKK